MLWIVLCGMLFGSAEASQTPAERGPRCVSADATLGVLVRDPQTEEVKVDERLVIDVGCQPAAAERAWTSVREAVEAECREELTTALCRAIVAELPGGPGGANAKGAELSCKHRVRTRTEGVNDRNGRPLLENERRDDLRCTARDGSDVRIQIQRTERTQTRG